MFWAVVAILLILSLLLLAQHYFPGGFLPFLSVIALVLLIVQLISGRLRAA